MFRRQELMARHVNEDFENQFQNIFKHKMKNIYFKNKQEDQEH